MEVWRDIPGRPSYQVSDLGHARSLDRVIHSSGDRKRGPYERVLKGRRLKLAPDAAGYLSFGQQSRIHVLVLLAFVGPCPDGLEARHRDGNKRNNKLTNLIYGTKSANEMDKIAHGTSNRGSRHGMAKLTEQEVKLIRRLAGTSNRKIADDYGVSETAIRKIRSRDTWGWL